MPNPSGRPTGAVHTLRAMGVAALMILCSSCGDGEKLDYAQEWHFGTHMSGMTRNGRKHGRWVGVENGDIVRIEYWRDGVSHGPFRRWNELDMYIDGNYENGLLHGRYRIFYRPGQLAELSWYSHGEKERTWCSWEPDGSLEYIREYRFNKLRSEELRPPGQCPLIFNEGARHLDQDDQDFR